MPGITGGGDCGKPNCDREAEESYEGPNGNSVRVCGMHYYKLVTGRKSETSPLGLGTDRITQPPNVDLDTSGEKINPSISPEGATGPERHYEFVTDSIHGNEYKISSE